MKKELKIIIYSLIGLVFLYLTFRVNWGFIIGALSAAYLNQRELMKG